MTVGTKKGFSIYSIQAPGPNGVRQIHSSGEWEWFSLRRSTVDTPVSVGI